MDAVYIISVGILLSISTGILGSFLLLRRMAMIGDAISHAVLPGIAIAFLFSGSREPITMVLGAGIVGVVTVFLIQFLHERIKLQTDASIGFTFTSFFALGVILITAFASRVDLDQECVLYGEIAYVPIDPWILSDGTIMGPRLLYLNAISMLLVLLFVGLFYRQLMLTTFDPSYAQAIGIRASRWHYALMSMVSFVVVSAFEAVGAILVVAMLIVPPATAYLMCSRLPVMLGVTCVVGVLCAVGGYYLAAVVDGSIAGAMTMVAGMLFLLVLVFLQLKKKLQKAPSS